MLNRLAKKAGTKKNIYILTLSGMEGLPDNWSKICNTVHFEILVKAPEEITEEIARIVEAEMEKATKSS